MSALRFGLKLVQDFLSAQRCLPKFDQGWDLLLWTQTFNFDVAFLVELKLKEVNQSHLILFERLTEAGFKVFVATSLHVCDKDPCRQLVFLLALLLVRCQLVKLEGWLGQGSWILELLL